MASITYETAVEKFKKNHRLDTDAPNTYPHVIASSIVYHKYDGDDGISYVVDNGRATEDRGWIYEADYPADS